MCGMEKKSDMGTVLKAELSDRNPYWINRHRYYELKHFCLQYPIWKQAYVSLTGLSKRPKDLALFPKGKDHGDPTARCAEARVYYKTHIDLLEKAAKQTSDELWSYLLEGVTEGLPYTALKTRYNIPCCKDTYYTLYRKFFWILNKLRD